ncbi:hypothetical protein O3P69_020558 [Scylla paramamosain]|uniref:Uncharacterized protein n=1 Tax=Scylla paramamosain TaxID=85552 RepID=A0AAW0TNJ7_SCYPA
MLATPCGKSSQAIRFTWVMIPGPATCDVKTSVALKVKYRSSHKLQTYKTVLVAPCPPARPPACLPCALRGESGRVYRRASVGQSCWERMVPSSNRIFLLQVFLSDMHPLRLAADLREEQPPDPLEALRQ